MEKIEIIGEKYGKWIVLSEAESKNHNRAFLCRCDCGTEAVVMGHNLRTGGSVQCTQCAWESHPGRKKTHGLTGTRIYNIWRGIKLRCYIPSHPSFDHYGGQGITMCDRWRNSFESFLEDMGKLPTQFHQIDRIDNEGNYEPNNCRWVLPKEQQNNRRNNIMISYKGETRSVADWASVLGVNQSTLYMRVKAGWPSEKVLSTPIRFQDLPARTKEPFRINPLSVQPEKRNITYISFRGESKSIWEWAITLNVNPNTLYWRIKAGWPLEKVLSPVRKKVDKNKPNNAS